MNTGSTVVHNTSQTVSVIAAIGLVACMMILSLGLAAVIWRDGNTAEVDTAMKIVGDVIPSLFIAAAALAGAWGAVSAFIQRGQNGNSNQPPSA